MPLVSTLHPSWAVPFGRLLVRQLVPADDAVAGATTQLWSLWKLLISRLVAKERAPARCGINVSRSLRRRRVGTASANFEARPRVCDSRRLPSIFALDGLCRVAVRGPCMQRRLGACGAVMGASALPTRA